MASALEPHLHLEVGHILFLDIVGYSKLLVDEQKESVQDLNRIVRETKQFHEAEAAGKLTRLPTGDGMVLVFTNNPEAPVECRHQAGGLSRRPPARSSTHLCKLRGRWRVGAADHRAAFRTYTSRNYRALCTFGQRSAAASIGVYRRTNCCGPRRQS